MDDIASIDEILQSRQVGELTRASSPESSKSVQREGFTDKFDHLGKLRIPARLAGFTVAQSRNKEWSSHFTRLSGLLGTGFVCAILGPCGTGKSQLATSLCKFTAHQGKRATMLEAMELCDSVKDAFGTESAKNIMWGFHRPDLLVIDELNHGLSEYDTRLIQRIVSRRYDTGTQDTILISNETPEEFCRLIGDRVVSRINETGGLLVFKWESFRK